MRDCQWHLDKLAKCRYLYIAEVEGCGLGIFAARPFTRGELVVVDEDGDYYEGVMSRSEAEARGLELSQDCFQIGVDRYLAPNGNLDDVINHSCEPNIGLKLTEMGYRMVAIRDIEAHDQLTYDYATYISGPYERMTCHCGSLFCRGEVGAFETLPRVLQRRYAEQGIVGRFALEAAGLTADEAAPAFCGVDH